MALILVVDDEPVVREVLGRLVRAAGHEVEEAPDGHQALERCRAHTPDIVFTDLKMTGMDGMEFADRLRKRYPEVRVLAVSGYQELLERAQRQGLPVMRKPCRLADVASAIEALLSQ